MDVIQAALLHDTVEDTDTSFDEIETEFGVNVCHLVRELTDDKSLPKAERKRLQVMCLLSFQNAATVLCHKLYMGRGAAYMKGELDFSPCNVHRKYKGRIRDECLSEQGSLLHVHGCH